jgi:hypothetical protein
VSGLRTPETLPHGVIELSHDDFDLPSVDRCCEPTPAGEERGDLRVTERQQQSMRWLLLSSDSDELQCIGGDLVALAAFELSLMSKDLD